MTDPCISLASPKPISPSTSIIRIASRRSEIGGTEEAEEWQARLAAALAPTFAAGGPSTDREPGENRDE